MLSANSNRRNLTKGQRAMAVARLNFPNLEKFGAKQQDAADHAAL